MSDMHLAYSEAQKRIGRLERDRAELIDFARFVVAWYENSGNIDPDQSDASSIDLWHKARALLQRLGKEPR